MGTEAKSTDELFSEAMNAMRKAYWAHVRSLADDVIQQARDGEFGEGEPAREALDTYLHETIDGDGWVIYTAKAQAVILVSDNDGAYAEEYGAEGIVTDGTINWSGLAYAALRADVLSQLDAHNFDVDDPDSWKPGSEE